VAPIMEVFKEHETSFLLKFEIDDTNIPDLISFSNIESII